MNAAVAHSDIMPTVVPMTVTALRILDDNGFFNGDVNRHELIDGVLVMTPPPGSGHYLVEFKAVKALVRMVSGSSFADDIGLQTGGALRISETTLLGPDLMIVPVPDENTLLKPQDVITLIEIASSSRTSDLGTKAKIYAGAQVSDYWVLDVAAKCVIVHRDPVGGAYMSVRTFIAPEQVACLSLPELSVAVSDLF